MARRDWADLTDAQKENLAKLGISPEQWNAGPSPIGPPSPPPPSPPTPDDDGDDEPDDLAEAVNDPDGYAGFWRGRTSERLSGSDREALEDAALRNAERELGDMPKYSHDNVARRMERMAVGQLRLWSEMSGEQHQRMARWAAEKVKQGDWSYAWLLYH